MLVVPALGGGKDSQISELQTNKKPCIRSKKDGVTVEETHRFEHLALNEPCKTPQWVQVEIRHIGGEQEDAAEAKGEEN